MRLYKRYSQGSLLYFRANFKFAPAQMADYDIEMKYIFTTNLSITDCLDRIRLNAKKDTILNWLEIDFNFEKKDIIFYKINKNTFRLQKHRRYRNSYAPLFYGILVKKHENTVIEGQFHMHPFVRFFMFIWFTGIILEGGIILFKTQFMIIGLLSQIIFIIFGIGLIKIGNFFGRNEKKYMIEFIEKTLKAKRT